MEENFKHKQEASYPLFPDFLLQVFPQKSVFSVCYASQHLTLSTDSPIYTCYFP